MSYPATLPSDPNGYDFGFGAFPVKHPGFEYNGNLYAFVTQTPTVAGTHDELCHAFKSTDAGNTWAEMDSANAPGGGIPSFSNSIEGGPQYTVARDGSTALIFSAQAIAVPTFHFTQLQLIRFDLSTDLWSMITSFVDPTDLDLQAVYTGQSPGDTHTIIAVSIRLIVLSAGSYVLYYSGPPDTVGGLNYGRLWYVTFTGTSFGTPVKLPNQTGAFAYFGLGAEVDASGIIHFIYGNTDTSGSVSIYHVGLNTSGFVFGSSQAIADSLQYWAGSTQQHAVTAAAPVIYTPSGGSESIAFAAEVWDPTVTFQNLTFFYALTALNPSWNQSVVTTGTDDTTGNGGHTDENIFPVPQGVGIIGGNLTLAEDGGTLALVWTVVLTAGLIGHIYYATAPSDTLVWTSETLLFDNGPISGGSGETPATQVYAFPMTGGIGVLGGANDYLGGNGNEIMQFDMIPVAGPAIPTCTLSAAPTSIVEGLSSTLTWTVTGTATSATIDNGVGAVDPTGGSVIVSPTGTVTYHLTVSNVSGSSNCQATVTVTPATCSLSSSASGGLLTITWAITGAATGASIDNGVGAVSPTGGSLTIPLPGVTTTYVLTVTSLPGTSACQTTVVVTPPVCTPVPACDEEPVIISHDQPCEALGS